MAPTSFGGTRPARPPAFPGRRRPDAKYCLDWTKQRLRAIHREARAAGQPSPLTEPAAHLYLLLASEVMNNRLVTEPLELRDLTRVMHCEHNAVANARKLLQSIGEIRQVEGGQGQKLVRFAFVKMGGPVLAVALASGDATSILEIEVPSNIDPKDRSDLDLEDRSTRVLRSQRSKYTTSDYVPSLLVGGTTTTADAEVVGLHVANTELEFLEWFQLEYVARLDVPFPGGLQDPARKQELQELGARVSWPFVQAMACEMFAVTPDGLSQGTHQSDRDFIATSNRSLYVLLRKAYFLTPRVLERAAAAKLDAAKHAAAEQRATDRDLPAHLGRILRKLRQAPPTALSGLLAVIADEISAFVVDAGDRRRVAERLEVLDAEMRAAARASADDQLKAAADVELEPFRQRMTRDQYEQSHCAAIDRLVRERFGLPESLIWDGAAAAGAAAQSKFALGNC